MVRGGVRKLACGVRRAGLLAAAVALALGAAACTTTGSGTTASIAPAGTTIAFESIDGPPPAVFRRLVQKLGDEAEARQLPLVSREGFAPYRVRGYLAAATERKARRTLISWVWDVYDAQQSRALRISGEETVSGAPADAWSAVDDALIARIAQKGMSQLADYLSRGGAQPEPAVPGREPDAATPVATAGDPKLALAE